VRPTVIGDGATGARKRAARLLSLGALLASFACFAGFDHRVAVDDNGIWSSGAQDFVRYGAIATVIGGALWYGGDEKLGHTFWESLDSMVFSGVTAEVAKRAFGRRRPSETPDPNDWFNGSCCRSFPSGEVTLQASVVTPFIVNYAGEHPWVWALEALPAYDAIARVKSGKHWQTDVLAGWALGTGFGYWAAKRDSPLFLQVMPRGIAVGIQKRF
jgi:membrane-associated phospholipid phosphatase